jgi:hypothetical protein
MPFHFNNMMHGVEIAMAIPRILNPAADRVISRTTTDGELLGGVIYESMISNCLFMHQAGFSKNWLSPEMLWLIFDYPFNQLRMGKVCGTVPSSKLELVEFNQRLGFEVEARIKDAYKDGDLVIMTMRREACRWLRYKPRTIRSNIQ